jgi:Sugar (and other) transporter
VPLTTNRPQLLISMVLMALQQLTGNAAVLAFTPEILTAASSSSSSTSHHHSSSTAAAAAAAAAAVNAHTRHPLHTLRHAYAATVVLGCAKAACTAVAGTITV